MASTPPYSFSPDDNVFPFLPAAFVGAPTTLAEVNSQIGYLRKPICLGSTTSGTLNNLYADPGNTGVTTLAAGTIQFTGVFGEPTLIPIPQFESNIKIFYMRQGLNQPGNRVFLARGSDIGYNDLEFSSLVTPKQVFRLMQWASMDPGSSTYAYTLIYSPDGGTTCYDCLFQKKGLVFKNFEGNQRIFSKVDIKLHILGVSVNVMPTAYVNDYDGTSFPSTPNNTFDYPTS